jgi:hypothetical protein
MGAGRKKMILLTALVLAAQIGAIFALHTRESLRVKLPPLLRGPFGGFATNSVGSELEDLIDPMAFAGAHERGFSAHAWLKRPHMELPLSNSIPPPTFLSFHRPPGQLPGENPFRGLPPQLPFVQFAISNDQPQESKLEVQGGIASRPLLTKIVPPIQFGSEAMSNTVVQLAVQADGFPFTSRILVGSGSRGADLTALQLTREARFAPLPLNQRQSNSLQWGELVFQWRTEPPPSTNAPAQASK